jgi:hypothetical protein
MTAKEKYRFFLNPYTDSAFTKCPKCDGKTKVKKFPLVIFIEKIKFVLNLNKTCKYCPYCELIIAKKSEFKQVADAYRVMIDDFFFFGTLPREIYVKYENKIMDSKGFLNIALSFKDVWDFTIQPEVSNPVNKSDSK